MTAFLRFIAVTNAAIWFGSAVFIGAGVMLALASPDMLNLIGRIHADAAYLIIALQFFYLQAGCAGVALGHLFLEWLYTGNPVRRGILILVLALGLAGTFCAFSIQPHLKQLHKELHAVQSTPEQRTRAAQPYIIWQRVTQGIHIFLAIGTLVYLWQISSPAKETRYGGGAKTHKFRG